MVDGKGNVLCSSMKVVDAYKNDGQFVRCSGEGLLELASDLSSDGHVIVLDFYMGLTRIQ